MDQLIQEEEKRKEKRREAQEQKRKEKEEAKRLEEERKALELKQKEEEAKRQEEERKKLLNKFEDKFYIFKSQLYGKIQHFFNTSAIYLADPFLHVQEKKHLHNLSKKMIGIKINLAELDKSEAKVDVNQLKKHESDVDEALNHLSRLNCLVTQQLAGPQLIVPYTLNFTAFPQITPSETGYFDRGLWFPNGSNAQ